MECDSSTFSLSTSFFTVGDFESSAMFGVLENEKHSRCPSSECDYPLVTKKLRSRYKTSKRGKSGFSRRTISWFWRVFAISVTIANFTNYFILFSLKFFFLIFFSFSRETGPARNLFRQLNADRALSGPSPTHVLHSYPSAPCPLSFAPSPFSKALAICGQNYNLLLPMLKLFVLVLPLSCYFRKAFF